MNNKNGFVGIMVANRAQRKFVLKQYLRYNTSNIKLFCFTPSCINWERKSVTGLYRSSRKWAESKFPFPRVVYNRCYAANQDSIERMAAAIGPDRCFNYINQFNKMEIYNRLNLWLGDFLPETFTYTMANAAQLLDRHKVIYFKPVYGHNGKGVFRAELNSAGEIHVGQHYFLPELIMKDMAQLHEHFQKLIGAAHYLIQKGVQMKQIDCQVFDIRALVQKNEKGLWSVTNLVSRIAYKGSFNTSVCEKVLITQEVLSRLYTPDRVNAIITSIYNISLRTAEIIDTNTGYHMGEFSVDFALDDDARPWIIELNGKPQKGLYKEIGKQSIVYKRPLQYAQYLCKR